MVVYHIWYLLQWQDRYSSYAVSDAEGAEKIGVEKIWPETFPLILSFIKRTILIKYCVLRISRISPEFQLSIVSPEFLSPGIYPEFISYPVIQFTLSNTNKNIKITIIFTTCNAILFTPEEQSLALIRHRSYT